jgi:hypothetical protein
MEHAICQIPPLFIRPISQSTRPTTSTWLNSTQVDLTPTSKCMTNELPINQVGRCINRAAWKELKRRSTEEECRWRRIRSRNNADGGVWIETLDDRVHESNGGGI